MSGNDNSTTPPNAAATTEAPATQGATGAGTQTQGEREAAAAESTGEAPKEKGWWDSIVEMITNFFTMISDFFSNLFGGKDETPPAPQQQPAAGQGNGRTLQQEIGDVTIALGETGKSGALQDNALSDEEKTNLKTELQQVRAALTGTVTDEARQAVSGMLETLVKGGVQDVDAILGQTITDLRTAVQPAAGAAR